MAYYLQCFPINKKYHGKDKENPIKFLGSYGLGESVPHRLMPPFPYALQGGAYEGGRGEDRFHMQVCGIWKARRIRLAEEVRVRRSGRSEGKGRSWTEALDFKVGHGSRNSRGKETPPEYQGGQVRMAGNLREAGKRLNIPTFFRIIGARYKRIRKRPRGVPSPQLYEMKKYQLQELVSLWKTGYIDLRFGDESHVCTSGYVPYGWQFAGEEFHVPSQKERRLNIFGMISPSCEYDGFETVESITGERLAGYIDEFVEKMERTTVLVLDNASIHRKGTVYRKLEEWKKKGLYVFFLPPYSPQLNIAEILWRMLKTQWLKPEHYRSRKILHDTTRDILAGIGKNYFIHFAHAS